MTDNTKLKNAFCEALGLPEKDINDTLEYTTHKKWDSTAHMILVAQLECDFDVMFDVDDIIDMSSFSKAKDILLKYNAALEF